jgi:hypothetical protein
MTLETENAATAVRMDMAMITAMIAEPPTLLRVLVFMEGDFI